MNPVDNILHGIQSGGYKTYLLPPGLKDGNQGPRNCAISACSGCAYSPGDRLVQFCRRPEAQPCLRKLS